MQLDNKKILFFPQNKTHIDNMIPVAKELVNKGYDVVFLDASSIYNQYIYEKNFTFNKIVLSLKLDKAFAFLTTIEKIKFITKYKKELLSYNFDSFSSFVYGNDGALQRVLIDKFKKKKHFLILDGIISDYSFSFLDILKISDNKLFDMKDFFRRLFKKVLNKFFAYLPYNYYFPSDVGCSRLTKVFVISDYVSLIIKYQIFRNTQVIVSGMPRYKFLKEYNSKNTGKKLNLLYITQGYLWHNEYENDRLQHETIKNLVKEFQLTNLIDKINFTIRIHPRDIKERYNYLLNYSWINIEDPSENIYESIKGSDLVIGVNSTVLLEAIHIGKEVMFLFLNNQYWRFERSFISDKIFMKVFNISNVIEEIKNRGKKPGNKLSIQHYFNPNSEKSSGIIVNEIIKHD